MMSSLSRARHRDGQRTRVLSPLSELWFVVLQCTTVFATLEYLAELSVMSHISESSEQS